MGFQFQKQVEQLFAVVFLKRGGRFVQDQKPDVLGQRLGDLHQLLLADTDLADQARGRFVQPHAGQMPFGLREGFVPVDDTLSGAFVAQKQVLGNRQKRDQRKLLMDDDDPHRLAVRDLAKLGQRAVVMDFAVIAARRVDARQNLHQGRFSGAVFAHKRVDFTRHHGEIDGVERLDPRKGLGDGAHLKQRLHRFPPGSAPPPKPGRDGLSQDYSTWSLV